MIFRSREGVVTPIGAIVTAVTGFKKWSRGQVEGHLKIGVVKQSSSLLQCSQGVKKQKQHSISFDHSYSSDYGAYGSDHPFSREIEIHSIKFLNSATL